LSFAGTPVIYYGDEIGMGDNIYLGDRNGVRTPMQWNDNHNAGFSAAPTERLYAPPISHSAYRYEAVNVAAQRENPTSLLNWMKSMIALRKRYRVFGRAGMELLYPGNRAVLAYLRRHEDQVVLAVANLSRFHQPFALDLSEFAGRRPVELLGGSVFPTIDRSPYRLNLGPHGFMWLAMEQGSEEESGGEAEMNRAVA